MHREDKIALVLVLLKQLQPYLSAQNLSMPKDDTLNKVLNNINVQTKKNDKLPRKRILTLSAIKAKM
jgi:hypothetical protein